MRCSCFGGPRVDRKKGTAAGTLHGINGENFVNYLTRYIYELLKKKMQIQIYILLCLFCESCMFFSLH
jgi:hypothetical protein